MIRAHFRLVSITEYAPPYSGHEVMLEPICYDEEHEHYSFTEYTPSGELKMYVNNLNVIDILRQHGRFAVDFTPLEGDATTK
jgi:hypothetical protein